MTLDEARGAIGRKVVYRARMGNYVAKPEEGIISSVNDAYVFVVYGGQAFSRATRPQDIELTNRPMFGAPHG